VVGRPVHPARQRQRERHVGQLQEQQGAQRHRQELPQDRPGLLVAGERSVSLVHEPLAIGAGPDVHRKLLPGGRANFRTGAGIVWIHHRGAALSRYLLKVWGKVVASAGLELAVRPEEPPLGIPQGEGLHGPVGHATQPSVQPSRRFRPRVALGTDDEGADRGGHLFPVHFGVADGFIPRDVLTHHEGSGPDDEQGSETEQKEPCQRHPDH
jgi:hypothetical protein